VYRIYRYIIYIIYIHIYIMPAYHSDEVCEQHLLGPVVVPLPDTSRYTAQVQRVGHGREIAGHLGGILYGYRYVYM
jgi:hypothetical protein